MALNAANVWEVRPAGSDSNGGGFNASATGTDRTQQDAAWATLTTLSVVTATTTIVQVNAANYTVTAQDVGNVLQITGGTATAGFYNITAADTTNNRWTLDRAAGTNGQTVAGAMGGGLASLGKIGGVVVNSNSIYIKSGTFTIASATINIATGCFSATATGISIEGYQTTRGDLGTKPLLQASGIATFTVISITGLGSSLRNVEIDGAGLTASRGAVVHGIAWKCKGDNCTNTAFAAATLATFIECVATGCSAVSPFAANAGCSLLDCVAVSNTITGFNPGAAVTMLRCLAYNNSGASSDGFALANAGMVAADCVAYNNGRDGFRISAADAVLENCIAESNAGFGYDIVNINDVLVRTCAHYDNTSGSVLAGTGKNVTAIGIVAGSGSFFTNAAGADFSLNNTAAAGASARGAGFPGVMPAGGTGALDIGALQHADPAGSGTTIAGTPLLRGMVG